MTVGYGVALPSRGKVTYVGYQPPYSSMLPSIYYYSISNCHFLTLGIMQKVSRTLTFLSDNAVNLGDDYNPVVNQRATVSFALRLDRPRHAFDLGLYSLISDSEHKIYGDPSVRLYPYLAYNLRIRK